MDPVKTACADLYISATRTTGNIKAYNTVLYANGTPAYTKGLPVSLPIFLFGLNDLQSGYSNMLKTQLALLNQAVPNISIQVTYSNGSVVFQYEDPTAGVIDTITIAYPGTNLTTYRNFLTNTTGERYKCDFVNYIISDAQNGPQQISNGIFTFTRITSGGSIVSTEKILNMSLLAGDPRNDRVGIAFEELEIDATSGFADAIIACPVADPSFTVYYNVTTR